MWNSRELVAARLVLPGGVQALQRQCVVRRQVRTVNLPENAGGVAVSGNHRRMLTGASGRFRKRHACKLPSSQRECTDGRRHARSVDDIVPIEQCSRLVSRQQRQFLHNLGVAEFAGRALMSHVVAVEHVQGSLLAHRNCQVWIRPGLIGQHQQRLVQILIFLVEIGQVVGREPVGEAQGAARLRELEYGEPEVRTVFVRAIGGLAIHIAIAVGREPAAPLPDPGSGSARFRVENSRALQSCALIRHYPAFLFRAAASIGTKGNVQISVLQQQRGAVHVRRVTKRVLLAAALEAGFDRDWAAGSFLAGGNIQGVQPMDVGTVFVGLRHHEKFAGSGVNDGRRKNSDFTPLRDGTASLQRNRDRLSTRQEETGLPERRCAAGVRVEGIHAVVHGGDIDDVVDAGSGNRDVGKVKGLADDGAVYHLLKQLPETAGIHITWRQFRLTGVRPGTGIVVVPGGDGNLGVGGSCEEKQNGKGAHNGH